MSGIGVLAALFFLSLGQGPFSSHAAISQATPAVSVGGALHLDKGGFADIAQAVTPAVVNITVRKEMEPQMSGNPFDHMPDFFGMPGMPERPNMPRRYGGPPAPEGQGAGSGVIVSSDGYILTNNHVVDNAKEITVTLPDKREFSGKMIGLDPQTDLAVVKIEGKDLPSVRWGDSSKLRVGEYVLAVGNPFGLNSTVTLGIVSALGRGGMGITQYEDFIQTDAAINPGNSGGALVNTQGELVGINTAIVSQSGGYQGVGFAVPTKLAKPVYASLVSTGTVVRGYLGVGIQEVTSDLAQSFHLDKATGALVTNVVSGSPADQAGIKRGDVIVGYQGQDVVDPRKLQQYVIGTTVGAKVNIGVIREGKLLTFSTIIQSQENKMEVARIDVSPKDGPLAGVAVQNLNEGIAGQFGLSEETNGVVVVEISPGSYAERAGMAQGDVIMEINRTPVRSKEDFVKITGQLSDKDSALVFIHRGKSGLYLTIKV